MNTSILEMENSVKTWTYIRIQDETLKSKAFSHLSFSGSLLTSNLLESCTFTDCAFHSSSFKKLVIRNTTFKNCTFNYAKLEGCNFYNCTFENCTFLLTNSLNCNFQKCMFSQCNNVESTIAQSTINNTEFGSMDDSFFMDETNDFYYHVNLKLQLLQRQYEETALMAA